MNEGGKGLKLRSMRNYNSLREHHYAALAAINNLYIEACAIVDALKLQPTLSNLEFEVPSTGGKTSVVERSPSALHALNAIVRREYEKSLILLISAAEDHLFSYVRLILGAHPQRLLTSYKGKEGQLTIQLSELLERGAEEILEDAIQARIHAAGYASPAEYLKYLNSILRKSLAEGAMSKFVEAKATRDIIVYARGIVNNKYLEKAGTSARAQEGDQLPIDDTYFKAIIATIKEVYASVYRIVLRDYGEDEKIADVLLGKGF
jgi:hypothetical protein